MIVAIVFACLVAVLALLNYGPVLYQLWKQRTATKTLTGMISSLSSLYDMCRYVNTAMLGLGGSQNSGMRFKDTLKYSDFAMHSILNMTDEFEV